MSEQNIKRSRATITGCIIDGVWQMYCEHFPKMMAAQTFGISYPTVERIIYACSEAEKGHFVRPSDKCPGKFVCDYVNKKFAQRIKSIEDVNYKDAEPVKDPLADSVEHLAKSIDKQNKLIEKFLAKLETKIQ